MNKILRERAEKIKKHLQSLKTADILLIMSLFLFCSVLSGVVLFLTDMLNHPSGIAPVKGLTLHVLLRRGMLSPGGLFLSAALLTLTLLLLYLKRRFSLNPNPVESRDERGVEFLEDGTYGTSRWMTESEASERFLTGDISEIPQTVYGQFSTDGKKVVAYNPCRKGGNKHVMLIGSTGSGKSVSFIRTEIIQSVMRGESVVCTDPSGELYTDLSFFAAQQGAEVKVLNLSSPENGNGWNCVAECISPETMSLDSGRLNDFADIYMKNTGHLASSDSFWAAAELNLLKAVIGLCAFKRDVYLNTHLKSLLHDILRHGGYSAEQVRSICSPITIYSPIIKVRRLIDTYSGVIGYDPRVIDTAIADIEAVAPPLSISEVYNTILSIDDEERFTQEFFPIPMTHPAAIAYRTYNSKDISEKIRASARMGLLNVLQIFNDQSLKGVLSVNDLDLSSIGEKQTILFIITPDKSDTLRPISSLAFSFLFKDLSDAWDKEQAASQREERKNRRLTVSVIMDEFYSVGAIPSFPVFIATCRKRLLNLEISLQNIGQLYDLYGENGGDTILSCCDTLLFLGCNDLTTAQFVSAFCAGESTIRSQSYRATGGMVSADPQIGLREASRRLITPDEVRRFTDGVLVVARGEQPLVLKRFSYLEHPVSRAGRLKKQNVYEIESVLDTSHYKDGFENVLLFQLFPGPGKDNACKDPSPAEAKEHVLPPPFAEYKKKDTAPPVRPSDEIVIEKAKYAVVSDIYPSGSDTPLEIDYIACGLLSSHSEDTPAGAKDTTNNEERIATIDSDGVPSPMFM